MLHCVTFETTKPARLVTELFISWSQPVKSRDDSWVPIGGCTDSGWFLVMTIYHQHHQTPCTWRGLQHIRCNTSDVSQAEPGRDAEKPLLEEPPPPIGRQVCCPMEFLGGVSFLYHLHEVIYAPILASLLPDRRLGYVACHCALYPWQLEAPWTDRHVTVFMDECCYSCDEEGFGTSCSISSSWS